MRTERSFLGLGVFFLYCALLAIAGPAMWWSARLGLVVPPARVQGFVGYFLTPEGDFSHVAVPLDDGRDLIFADEDLPADDGAAGQALSIGTKVEKRRGELSYRFDGRRAGWRPRASHVAFGAGGLLAFVALSLLVARQPLRGHRFRALAWLPGPARVTTLVLPGVATVLVGVVAAFARGELDRVTAVATLGAALAGALCGSRGLWRRLEERLVLARARRLALRRTEGVERVLGTVRRVDGDVVELALATPHADGTVQIALTGGARLGLGRAPHAPIAVGDRLEVLGPSEHVVDPRGETTPRGVALARRLMGTTARPVLIASPALVVAGRPAMGPVHATTL